LGLGAENIVGSILISFVGAVILLIIAKAFVHRGA